MNARIFDMPLTHLHGQTLADVTVDVDTREWVFTFSGQRVLHVAAPWRLLSDGRILVGSEDDGHQFGGQAPVDARERVMRTVEERQVSEASVTRFGDLDLRFDSGSTLQVFNGSSGYEGWQLSGPGDRDVVAQGGGRVVDSAENT